MAQFKFVIIVCVIIALSILIPPLLAMLAWNYCVAPFFKLPEITYVAAVGIWFLLGMIPFLPKGGSNAQN
jgi:hypothetical protein